MPIWCENDLTVTGDWDSLMEFFPKCIKLDGKFTLKGLLPTPESEKKEEWQLNNWGTRSDAEAYEDYKGDLTYYLQRSLKVYELHISFDTAWSAPTLWVHQVAPMFPELTFALAYLEREQFFCGELVMKGEEVIRNDFSDKDNNQFWDIIARTMDYSREDIVA